MLIGRVVVMTDRSNIIRRPEVVREEFRRIVDDLAAIRIRLASLGDEIEQVAQIVYEMQLGGGDD